MNWCGLVFMRRAYLETEYRNITKLKDKTSEVFVHGIYSNYISGDKSSNQFVFIKRWKMIRTTRVSKSSRPTPAPHLSGRTRKGTRIINKHLPRSLSPISNCDRCSCDNIYFDKLSYLPMDIVINMGLIKQFSRFRRRTNLGRERTECSYILLAVSTMRCY